ncbi:hypothetical protein [Undibacterium rugosum]|uniref:Uncharacterized protein n=1 Tax=Undibacterium rugosum TaxID=2762291 RepID=A0A923KZZ6_9BURK|nr:hypothetical protein [Undibacterium rugosum]MBC3936890.1 hypothetical protein [Undibacterium rugosum]MBR7780092.1 hypothetical protein [Undibacterium rugosum]
MFDKKFSASGYNTVLNIISIAWIYVVLLMAMTETSIVAGIMTFIMYCVVPLSILLYLMRSPQRKRTKEQRIAAMQQRISAEHKKDGNFHSS